jgi:N-acetylglucosamine-6-phosphate deacetylase
MPAALGENVGAMGLLIRGATALLPGGLEPATDLRIAGDRIDCVGKGLAAGRDEVIDARGLTVAPGFVDLHIHGAAGAMCEDGDTASVVRISTELARFGVTGFLATVATLPTDELRACVRAIAATAGREPGARILGIHLEGPYLSPHRAGAQAVEHMRPPSVQEIDELQEIAAGSIRMITVAPEIPEALPFIAAMRQRGIKVSLGHADATLEETLRGVEAGATHVTHLFNAMRPLHHREPGLIGAALTDERLSVELICDGHHVSPSVVDLTLRCKPAGAVVLVSDAVAALGQTEGRCHILGTDCVIDGGAVRRRDGTLAGSCLSLDQSVRNVHAWLPTLPRDRLLAAASSDPAAVIGESHALLAGESADLVALDDNLHVQFTICRSRVVFRR